MATAPHAARAALADADIDRLQALLDAVPAPLEPLDASAIDGYLCGVLLQPRPVAAERWLRHATDADGRALPAGYDASALHALLRRRHAELGAAIANRNWFDPWVFELEASPAAGAQGETGESLLDPSALAARDAVYPWVAGFATAMELFPALMQMASPAALEPLALIYRHLDPDDLENADDLLEVIDGLEPPADLAEAVEQLVRATLLLADVSRPRAAAQRAPARSGRRR